MPAPDGVRRGSGVRDVSRRGALIVGVTGAVAGSGALGACAGSGDGSGPGRLDLAELSDRQEDLDGATITTSGVVVRFEDTGGVYYVIEDVTHNRVRVEPAERFADLVGDQVVVTGRFAFDETTGRTLEVTDVHPPT